MRLHHGPPRHLAEIPVLLVSDALGMVVLGHSTTLPVTLDDIVQHARAMARGNRRAAGRLVIPCRPAGW